MTIELHIEGKVTKIWIAPYYSGPFPMTLERMNKKQLDLDKVVLECKLEVLPLIYSKPYQMFAVIRSRMKPEELNPNDYAEFLITVAKNTTKKRQLR